MFEALTDNIRSVLRKISGRGRLSEKDVAEACRELRLALLQADVNYQVAREFIRHIEQRAVGQEVAESLTPGQQFGKIVHEEMTALLGGESASLRYRSKPPSVFMLVGPQGGGKTTTCAKLALHLKHHGQHPLLVGADVKRPAAIEQLRVLAGQAEIPAFEASQTDDGTALAREAVSFAAGKGLTPVIIDTAGRLHSDDEMMQEASNMKDALAPDEVLLVVDAMTGQDAVNMGKQFQERVGLTGCIVTKLDGDARGGAALSLRHVTGQPIKFAGTGEHLGDLEPFHPDRMASRILGMGDVLTLIEKAEEAWDEKQAKRTEKRLRTGQFNLADFLEQMEKMTHMGPIERLAELIPGLPSGLRAQVDESAVKVAKAVIESMTRGERENPEIIDGSRKKRIAHGSGANVQQVNQLLRQFAQMKTMLRGLSAGKRPARLPIRWL
jgi:signal recognition particle subunit SRP54